MVMGDQQQKRKKLCNVPEEDRWIVCDSKSNPGRKYYFNPSTKQKLWHLTDEEIKEKEKKTHNVISQPNGTNIDKQLAMPKIYDEASTSEPKIINIMHPSNFVQPTIPLIQQTLPTAFINSPYLCNQIMNPSTQTPLVNLKPGNFNCINQMQNIERFSSNFDINTYQSTNPVEIHESNYTIDSNTDLRNKIKNKHFKQHHIFKNNINVKEETDVNVSWDAETVKDILSYLRGYAAPHARTDRWYIVPDTLVVINHSRLLYQMTEGQRCCLKIPQFVRIKLKHLEKETANEAISRFLRYHCPEKDTAITPPNDRVMFCNIVNTCQHLAEDNYHVVLLCYTDKNFKSYKKALNTPVFTVNKIRELHSQGRIIPRNSTILSETVPVQSFIDETKNNNKKISKEISILDTENKKSKLTLQIVQDNNPEIPVNNISTESESSKIDEQPEKLDTAIVEHNICSSKADASSVKKNVKIISTSNNHLDSNKSTKKRIIKLKPACIEIHTGAHSSKKKRWSAVRNKNQELSFVKLESMPSGKVTGNISENLHHAVFPKADAEDIPNRIVELPKEQSDDYETLTSGEPVSTVVAKTSTSNIDSNKKNSDYEDKTKSTVHFKTTTGIFTDCPSKTIHESDFENLSTQGNRWIEKFDQIMKDVLMRVLGQDTTVDVKEMPQLQRLHKVILDIIRNFSHCWLIVDAANKLSMKITQSRDSKGALKFDQKFFDDMYIYGVNLVDALQGISSSVKHIENAKRLLENIRDDISIFNGDSCHNISTVLPNNCKKNTEEDNIVIEIIKPNTECKTAKESTIGSINVNANRTSKKRKLYEIADQENVYFTALKLRKKDNQQVVKDDNIPCILESDEQKNLQLNSNMEKNGNISLVDMQPREYLSEDIMDGKDEQLISNLEKNGNNSLADMLSKEYLSKDITDDKDELISYIEKNGNSSLVDIQSREYVSKDITDDKDELISNIEKNGNNSLVDMQSREYVSKYITDDKDEQLISNIEKNGNNSLVDIQSREYSSKDITDDKDEQLIRNMEKTENNSLVDMQPREYFLKDVTDDKDEQLISNMEKNGNNSLVDMQSRDYLSEDTAVGICGRCEIENQEQINNVYRTVCSKMLEDDLEFKSKYENIQNIEYVSVEDESNNILISNNLGNETFKRFIGMLVKEIREALIVCAQNFEMCITHQNVVNNDLSEKFHEVHAHLYHIQRLLDSILHRENGDVNNNFLKSSLKKAGVDKFDQNMCDQYRCIINKCRNEVNAFLKILERKFDHNCDVPLPSPQYV